MIIKKLYRRNWTPMYANQYRRGSYNLFISALICVLFTFVFSLPVFASSIDSIQLLKISPQDGRAIIKMPDGKMQIIKVGDEMQSDQRSTNSGRQKGIQKVIEITKGRVVFEENTEKGIETVIIRLENGKQRTERIKKTLDKQPVILKSN